MTNNPERTNLHDRIVNWAKNHPVYSRIMVILFFIGPIIALIANSIQIREVFPKKESPEAIKYIIQHFVAGVTADSVVKVEDNSDLPKNPPIIPNPDNIDSIQKDKTKPPSLPENKPNPPIVVTSPDKTKPDKPIRPTTQPGPVNPTRTNPPKTLELIDVTINASDHGLPYISEIIYVKDKSYREKLNNVTTISLKVKKGSFVTIFHNNIPKNVIPN